ncbi:hypothetical protein WJX81_001919 [Elliptochloris bilobata]|uniref:TLC domain-containing protein n=1 Tax=Elliptochloris bilobata TaxID=381761 RepID=A0AAW1RXF8_9CHLO
MDLVSGEHLKQIPGAFILFSCAFCISYVYVGAVWGLRGERRGMLGACAASLLHGLVTATLSAQQLAHWPVVVDATNSHAENLTLQISTAYMLTDSLLFLLPFTPTDVLFIGHHIMTTTYMVQSLLLQRGAQSALVLILLGELTSPLQNLWYFARYLKDRSQVAARAFALISPVYTYIYLLVRSGIAPPAVVWLAYALVTSDGRIAPGYRWTWAVFAVLGTLGSQVWCYKLYRGLLKHSRAQRAQKAAKAV